jgi:Fe-S cluster assembly protein SufD
LADGATPAAAEHTEPDWLKARRQRAADAVGTLELPQHRGIPGWEFTDLSDLDLDAYPVANGNADRAAIEGAERLWEPGETLARVEQVDGSPVGPLEVDPGESDADDPSRDAPARPVLMPLAAAAERYPDLIQAHFGTVVSGEDPFVARNEAGWSGGAFLYVPRGQRLEAPAQITAVQDAAGSALNWRTLIVLEEGAEAEVWEQYLSADTEVEALFNGVVELHVGPNAHLRYLCGQSLSERSWVFGTQRAEVDRDGSLDWVALGFGSARGKVRMETKLTGAGSSAKVTGAYAGHGRQHLDFDTTQEHAAPSTTSDLAFRGVLDGRATAVWRGMIRVDPGAQQTDAFQESRNLLLSKRAHADAIPGLEIEANDVRCTHAAAVAQVDKDQLFYLMARGLGREDATRLIIDGFMQELVERFAEGPVREALSHALERRLEEILGA